MQFIKKFKSALLNRIIRSETKKQNRSNVALNIEDCKSILILFDADKSFEVNHVLKLSQHLREQSKRVFLLATSASEINEQKPYSILTKKEMNWFGKPKQTAQLDQVMNKEWDCMLSLYSTPDSTLDYIGAKCMASTKAGFYHGNIGFLDIMLDARRSDNYKNSVSNLFNILKTIKSRSYEPAI